MFLALFWILIFILAIVLLIKSSDWFTDAAEKIGLSFGLSPFIIGVTIVAVGTSLPELISSILAVSYGTSEIVIGNVLGSNIANILLILGITAIVGKMDKKVYIARELIKVDLPLLIGSAFLLGLMIIDGSFTWVEGLLCLSLLVVYLIYTFDSEKHTKGDKQISKEFSAEKRELLHDLRRQAFWLTWGKLFGAAFLIFFGAKYVVVAVVNIADIFSTSPNIIAVTAVALGTSLPELAVSLAAARKKKFEIAIGNVLGSNIFNTLAVMGIPSFFGALVIPPESLFFALPVMIVATFLYLFITQDKQITKWEGWLLVIFYVFFVLTVIGLT